MAAAIPKKPVDPHVIPSPKTYIVEIVDDTIDSLTAKAIERGIIKKADLGSSSSAFALPAGIATSEVRSFNVIGFTWDYKVKVGNPGEEQEVLVPTPQVPDITTNLLDCDDVIAKTSAKIFGSRPITMVEFLVLILARPNLTTEFKSMAILGNFIERTKDSGNAVKLYPVCLNGSILLMDMTKCKFGLGWRFPFVIPKVATASSAPAAK